MDTVNRSSVVRAARQGRDGVPDFVTHSPDGESRGLMFRVGDIFPLDPRPHQRLRIDDPASAARPWGLRFLRVPQPRAGKHESVTGKHTTGGGGDNSSPEDEGTD